MLITDVLAAPSSSDDTTFSIPILVGTAALGVGWILLLVAVAPWRRPHGIRSGPATQDLPPVPPAVAGLLCNDFELPAELPPATLLDLAARHVVRPERRRQIVLPGSTSASCCWVSPPVGSPGRSRSYRAAVMGVAPTAVALLPFGAEDDNGAWSPFGGRWRRVRVGYPRGWPPGWGKHPAFATFLAVL